ncbi:hypothetical protein ASPVEDRAFT_42034 [Aspergillus versicolor CBS 583.65]|uniref:Mtf2-like C-terminal domain-containing protein n=1 Tax=Aspergillus versicolor CBS 583.65 TaxID=1036611 RepID=A0A1L9PM09_ASPVE|nr:uncharacterized protein ASPVEDRAFT_42034 [Aspergillus versicolor CBS 583.65]OJJ02541.1 hypothetical protein ASPVEDRAFT_42034 [Aspergillus versicolor CBS 583.65]
MSIQRRIALAWLVQTQVQAARNSLTPFLYQTTTLTPTRPRSLSSPPLRCSSYSTSDAPSSPSIKSLNQSRNDDSIGPSDNKSWGSDDRTESPPPSPGRSFLRRKGASVAKHKRALDAKSDKKPVQKPKWKPRPKLTTHESRTLAELFLKLPSEKRRQVSPQESEKSEAEVEAEAEADQIEAKKAEESEMSEISAIFDVVLRDVQKRKDREVQRNDKHNAEEGKVLDAKSQEDAIKTQNKIFHLPDTDEELAELLNKNEMTLANAIELVIARETTRINSILHAAVEEKIMPGKFWKLCQTHVFSMAQHLRREDETPVSGQAVKPSRRSKTPESPLKVPPCVPIESVVVAVYPRVLRTAFALLNVHFPDSYLVSEFRAKVTSLGRESATLGLSAQLYNDMIYFHWRVTHDIADLVTLLREMELTGVNPTAGTITIINSIVEERQRDLRRRQRDQPSDQPWWDHPPNRKAFRQLTGEDTWGDGLLSRMTRLYKNRKLKKVVSDTLI